MSQPTDKSVPEDRDLKGEADEIKKALTANKDQPYKDIDKTQKVKEIIKINFTTLAQSVIPGNFLRKRLGRQIHVEYIPDFYYIMELCQRIFVSSKLDKSLKKTETANIHSFTLYLAHSLMYAYLKIVSESNPPNVDLTVILNVYLRAGYDTNKLPAICSHWLSGLGKFKDPDSHRVFMPTLPVLDNGALGQSGFFSGNTGHLLPNTYCLMAITRLAATRSTNLMLHTIASTQSANGYFGLISANADLVNSTICRANALRVPGAKAIGMACDDTLLLEVIQDSLSTTFLDPVQNLLKVTPNLLAHLKLSQVEFLGEIETISLDPISPVGTSMCTIPLISLPDKAIVKPQVDIAAVVGPPAVGRMFYFCEYDHNSRISTRHDVINGFADYVYQTPLVRICDQNDSIIAEGFVFTDPQHEWYSAEHEFDTLGATLNETRAYFKRMI